MSKFVSCSALLAVVALADGASALRSTAPASASQRQWAPSVGLVGVEHSKRS